MKDKMLVINDMRIAISDIKQYGIEKRNTYFQKVYTQEANDKLWPIIIYKWHGDKVEVNEKVANNARTHGLYRMPKDGTVFTEPFKRAKKSDFIVGTKRGLYLKTYQGEDMFFAESEVSFNIDEKCKEIDKMFNEE